MKKIILAVLLATTLLVSPDYLYGQQSIVVISDAEIQRIISTFPANETKFREKLNHYQFKRDALIERIGTGIPRQTNITGIYHRVSNFVFDDKGQRYERIIYFPPPVPVGEMDHIVTQEDLDDLGGIQPFALEASQIDKYKITYIGREHIDELDTYVFDVAPKVMPNHKKTKERYFVGRIWVEDQGLQIVKTRGKAVPETDKNKFPTFETYREQIDGKYWFPTYTYADEILEYPDSRMHIRMKVAYSDFKEYRAEVKIIDADKP